MTTINMSFRRPRADGDHVPARGYVEWVPSVRRDMEGYILLPQPFKVTLLNGDATVIVAPTTTEWYWKVTEYFEGIRNVGTSRYYAVPDSITAIDFDDLVQVNSPDSGTPVLPPNWTSDLNNEIVSRINADDVLQDNIDAVAGNGAAGVAAEQARAEAAEADLQSNIDDEEAARVAADSALDTRLDDAEAELDGLPVVFAPISEPVAVAHIGDVADAHDASAISFAPAAGIGATDVQAAIVEVRDDAATALAAEAALARNANNLTDGTVADARIAATIARDIEVAAVQADIDAHEARTDNPHAVTKAQVGLSNVDDTSDVNKPVSTAQAAADALKVSKTGDTMTGKLTITGSHVGIDVSTPSQTKRIIKKTDNAVDQKDWRELVTPDGDWRFGAFSDGDASLFDAFRAYRSGVRFDLNGIGYIKGTGFPEGAVTAPVGSRYIDTEATNGAIEWIKVSGAGNTGWVVVYGDTGWRDLSSLLTNGWTLAAGAGVLVRRVGAVVHFKTDRLNGSAKTGDTFITTLPTGFRPNLMNEFVVGLNGGGSITMRTHVNTDGTATMTGTDANFNRMQVTYTTTNQWPATLPGVAA